MTIEFLKDWKQFKPGQRMEMADGVANVLIKRHLARKAKPLPEPPPEPVTVVETAAKVAPVAETATVKTTKARR